MLVEPVEDPLAADAVTDWLAVRVRAFFLAEPEGQRPQAISRRGAINLPKEAMP